MAIFKDAPQDKTAAKIDSAPSPLFEAHDPSVDAIAIVSGDRPWWLTEPPKKRTKRPWPANVAGSPAKIELAHLCMAKFQAKYREKRPDPSSPNAIVGRLVHGAHEDAATRRVAKERRGIPGVASVEELVFLLDFQPAQIALEEDPGDAVSGHVTPEMLDEARKVLATGGPANFRDTWAVEHTWSLAISPSFSVGGRIDRIDLLGVEVDNPRVVVIVDYKATQTIPDQSELWDSTQAGLYLAWARRRWPKADEIRFRLLNLRHPTEPRLIVWSQALEDYHLSSARAAFHLWNTGTNVPTPGDHCQFCPYRDGDGKHPACKGYQDELAASQFVEAQAGGLEKHTLPELLRIYRRSSTAEELHGTRRLDVRKTLLRKLNGVERYASSDLLCLVEYERDAKTFSGKLALFKALAELTKTRVEDLVEQFTSVRGDNFTAWVDAIPEEHKKAAAAIVQQHEDLAPRPPKLSVRRTKGMW